MKAVAALACVLLLPACDGDDAPERHAADAGVVAQDGGRDAAPRDASGCTAEQIALYDRLRTDLEALFGSAAPPLDLINLWYAMHMAELDAVWAACPDLVCAFVLQQYERCRTSNGPDAAEFTGCIEPPPECL